MLEPVVLFVFLAPDSQYSTRQGEPGYGEKGARTTAEPRVTG